MDFWTVKWQETFLALLCFRCYLYLIGPLMDSDSESIFQLPNFMPLFNYSTPSSIKMHYLHEVFFTLYR